MLIAKPPVSCANFFANSLALRNVRGHLLSPAHQKLPEGPEPRALPAHLDLALQRLHAKQNHTLPRPSHRLQHTQGLERVTQQRDHNVFQPECDPLRTRAPSVRSVVSNPMASEPLG